MSDINYIMEEYFHMKKENEEIKKQNYDLRMECRVNIGRAEEAEEQAKAMRKKNENNPKGTAEWIDQSPRVFHRCSSCGQNGYAHYLFCPWCGSKMLNGGLENA